MLSSHRLVSWMTSLALLDKFDLARLLALDSTSNRLEGVQVLHLGSGAELLCAHFAHGQVYVCTHGALLQFAVGSAQILNDQAQLLQISDNLIRTSAYPARIRSRSAARRFGCNPPASSPPTHRGSASRHPPPYESHGFRWTFLPGGRLDLHMTVSADRQIQLGDLVVLRVIRIEIILPVELAVAG